MQEKLENTFATLRNLRANSRPISGFVDSGNWRENGEGEMLLVVA